MAPEKAEAEINRGIAADEVALYGQRRSEPTTPFFRFPGFASSPALLDRVNARGMVVFGADVWTSDWDPMSPDRELRLILARIDQVGRGIVLFHDTKSQTAQMLRPFCASSNGADTASFTSCPPQINRKCPFFAAAVRQSPYPGVAGRTQWLMLR